MIIRKYILILLTLIISFSCSKENSQLDFIEQDPRVQELIPKIQLKGDNPFELDVFDEFEDPGFDIINGLIDEYKDRIIIEGEVDPRVLGDYIITYKLKKEDGTFSEEVKRTVRVVDRINPEINLSLGDEIVDVGDLSFEDFTEISSTDNYDGNVDESFDGVVIIPSFNINVVDDYTFSYTVNDSSGNSTTKSRLVKVVDRVNPTIEVGENITINLNESISLDDVIINDNYDEVNQLILTTNINEIPTNQVGIYQINYRVEDSSGNFALANKLVTVRDNIPPVITLNGGNNVFVDAPNIYQESNFGFSALDNIDGDITSNVSVTGTVGSVVGQTYTLSYTVTDQALNTTTVQRNVTIRDNQAPVITLNGPSEINLFGDNPYVEESAVVTDNVDQNLVVIISGDTVDISKTGTYVIRYNVSDGAGNPAIEKTRIVNVIDNQKPILSNLIENNIRVRVNSAFEIPQPTATDNFDNNVTASFDTTFDITKPDTYTVTYRSIDASNNEVVEVRNIIVFDDEPPTITINGDNPYIVNVNEEIYTELGASVSDNVDQNLVVEVSGDTVNSNAIGIYQVRYNATDNEGNPALEKVREVRVEDNSPPLITLSENSIDVDVNSRLDLKTLASVNDTFDQNVSLIITGDNNFINNVQSEGNDNYFFNNLGSYQVFYNATDSEGNNALEKTLTINVLDNIPPEGNLIGDSVILLTANRDVYVEESVSVTDNGGNPTVERIITLDGNVVTEITNEQKREYLVTYNISDDAGNTLVLTRTVRVIDDEAPTISGQNIETIEFGSTFVRPDLRNPPLISVNDNLDTNPSLVASGNVDTSISNSYSITYIATDDDGNNSLPFIFNVNVQDTIPPVISSPENILLNIDQGVTFLNNLETIEATDESGIASFTKILSPTFNGAGTYSYTLTATDNSGLTATKTISVVFEDTTPPSVSGNLALNLEWGEAYSNPVNLVYQDNDTSDNSFPTLNLVSGEVLNQEEGVYTLNYLLTDKSGLTTSFDYIVTVEDTINPEITVNNSSTINNINLEAGQTIEDININATDLSGIKALNSNLNEPLSTFKTYQLTITAIDNNDNESVKVINVNYEDTVAPVLTGPQNNTEELELGSVFTDPLLQVTDNFDQGLIPSKMFDNLNTNVVGDYIIRYQAQDSSGNVSNIYEYNILVRDNVDPTILVDNVDISTPFNLNLEYGNSENDLSVSFSDASGIATSSKLLDRPLDDVGSYVYTLFAEDNSGRTNTKVININYEDTTNPQFSGLSLSKTVDQYSDFVEDNFQVNDIYNDDRGIPLNVTKSYSNGNSINTDIRDQQTITYSVSDANGNSTNFIQTININPLNILLSNNISYKVGLGTSLNIDLSTLASHRLDGNISYQIITNQLPGDFVEIDSINKIYTPSTLGNYDLLVRASADNGDTLDINVPIEVFSLGEAPQFLTNSDLIINGVQGEPLNIDLEIATADDPIRYEINEFPQGGILDSCLGLPLSDSQNDLSCRFDTNTGLFQLEFTYKAINTVSSLFSSKKVRILLEPSNQILGAAPGDGATLLVNQQNNIFGVGQVSARLFALPNNFIDDSFIYTELNTINVPLGQPIQKLFVNKNSAIAQLEDGTLYGWGENINSQIGVSNVNVVYEKRISSISNINENVVDLNMNDKASCALTNANEMYCWGSNQESELGTSINTIGTTSLQNVNFPVNDPIISISKSSTGSSHMCAILNDSERDVYCWGSNQNRELGTSSIDPSVFTPAIVLSLENERSKKIVTGNDNTCILYESGKLHCWGKNEAGVLTGVNPIVPVSPATELSFGQNIKDVAFIAGGQSACAILEDNSVTCWGKNDNNQLGYGDTEDRGDNELLNSIPSLTDNFNLPITAKQIFNSSSYNTCIIDLADQIYCWGSNQNSSLGFNGPVLKPTPINIIAQRASPFLATNQSDTYNFIVNENTETLLSSAIPFRSLDENDSSLIYYFEGDNINLINGLITDQSGNTVGRMDLNCLNGVTYNQLLQCSIDPSIDYLGTFSFSYRACSTQLSCSNDIVNIAGRVLDPTKPYFISDGNLEINTPRFMYVDFELSPVDYQTFFNNRDKGWMSDDPNLVQNANGTFSVLKNGEVAGVISGTNGANCALIKPSDFSIGFRNNYDQSSCRFYPKETFTGTASISYKPANANKITGEPATIQFNITESGQNFLYQVGSTQPNDNRGLSRILNHRYKQVRSPEIYSTYLPSRDILNYHRENVLFNYTDDSDFFPMLVTSRFLAETDTTKQPNAVSFNLEKEDHVKNISNFDVYQNNKCLIQEGNAYCSGPDFTGTNANSMGHPSSNLTSNSILEDNKGWNKIINESGDGFLNNLVEIEAGIKFSCALNSNGEVLCWGKNAAGCGENLPRIDGGRSCKVIDQSDQILNDVRELKLGSATACALVGSNKDLYCWGYKLDDTNSTFNESEYSNNVDLKARLINTPKSNDKLYISKGNVCIIHTDKDLSCMGKHFIDNFDNFSSTSLNELTLMSKDGSQLNFDLFQLTDDAIFGISNDVPEILTSYGNKSIISSSDNLNISPFNLSKIKDLHVNSNANKMCFQNNNDEYYCWGRNVDVHSMGPESVNYIFQEGKWLEKRPDVRVVTEQIYISNDTETYFLLPNIIDNNWYQQNITKFNTIANSSEIFDLSDPELIFFRQNGDGKLQPTLNQNEFIFISDFNVDTVVDSFTTLYFFKENNPQEIKKIQIRIEQNPVIEEVEDQFYTVAKNDINSESNKITIIDSRIKPSGDYGIEFLSQPTLGRLDNCNLFTMDSSYFNSCEYIPGTVAGMDSFSFRLFDGIRFSETKTINISIGDSTQSPPIYIKENNFNYTLSSYDRILMDKVTGYYRESNRIYIGSFLDRVELDDNQYNVFDNNNNIIGSINSNCSYFNGVSSSKCYFTPDPEYKGSFSLEFQLEASGNVLSELITFNFSVQTINNIIYTLGEVGTNRSLDGEYQDDSYFFRLQGGTNPSIRNGESFPVPLVMPENTENNYDTPSSFSLRAIDNVSQLSVYDNGFDKLCYLTNGNVYCSDRNAYINKDDVLTPSVSIIKDFNLNSLNNVTSVVAGDFQSCAIMNGNVYCWSEGTNISNNNVSLKNGCGYRSYLNPDGAACPIVLEDGSLLNNVIQIDSHEDTSCALTNELGSKKVYCWGRDLEFFGQNNNYAKEINYLNDKEISQIALGGEFTSTALCSIGKLDTISNIYCVGNASYWEAPDTNYNELPLFAEGEMESIYSSNSTYWCAKSFSDELHCWGRIPEHITLNGTQNNNIPQVFISDISSWKDFKIFKDTICYRDNTDILYCRGSVRRGKIGVESGASISADNVFSDTFLPIVSKLGGNPFPVSDYAISLSNTILLSPNELDINIDQKPIRITVAEQTSTNILIPDLDFNNFEYNVVQKPSTSQGALSGTFDNLIFTPSDNFKGITSIIYTVYDKQRDLLTSREIIINVQEVNNKPMIDDREFLIKDSNALNFNLFYSDDSSSNEISCNVTPIDGLSCSPSTNNNNCSCSYISNINDSTQPITVSTTYTVSDGLNTSDPANINFIIWKEEKPYISNVSQSIDISKENNIESFELTKATNINNNFDYKIVEQTNMKYDSIYNLWIISDNNEEIVAIGDCALTENIGFNDTNCNITLLKESYQGILNFSYKAFRTNLENVESDNIANVSININPSNTNNVLYIAGDLSVNTRFLFSNITAYQNEGQYYRVSGGNLGNDRVNGFRNYELNVVPVNTSSEAFENIHSISSSNFRTCFINESVLYCQGEELGFNRYSPRLNSTTNDIVDGVYKVITNEGQTCAFTEIDNSLICTGQTNNSNFASGEENISGCGVQGSLTDDDFGACPIVDINNNIITNIDDYDSTGANQFNFQALLITNGKVYHWGKSFNQDLISSIPKESSLFNFNSTNIQAKSVEISTGEICVSYENNYLSGDSDLEIELNNLALTNINNNFILCGNDNSKSLLAEGDDIDLLSLKKTNSKTCFLRNNNSLKDLYCQGSSSYGEFTDPNDPIESNRINLSRTLLNPTLILAGINNYFISDDAICVIEQQNQLSCWGNNATGKLINPDNIINLNGSLSSTNIRIDERVVAKDFEDNTLEVNFISMNNSRMFLSLNKTPTLLQDRNEINTITNNVNENDNFVLNLRQNGPDNDYKMLSSGQLNGFNFKYTNPDDFLIKFFDLDELSEFFFVVEERDSNDDIFLTRYIFRITPENDPPDIQDNLFQVGNNSQTTIDLDIFDSDDSTFTFEVITPSSLGGQISFSGNRLIYQAPDLIFEEDEFGNIDDQFDDFQIRVTDSGGLSDDAWFAVIIKPSSNPKFIDDIGGLEIFSQDELIFPKSEYNYFNMQLATSLSSQGIVGYTIEPSANVQPDLVNNRVKIIENGNDIAYITECALARPTTQDTCRIEVIDSSYTGIVPLNYTATNGTTTSDIYTINLNFSSELDFSNKVFYSGITNTFVSSQEESDYYYFFVKRNPSQPIDALSRELFYDMNKVFKISSSVCFESNDGFLNCQIGGRGFSDNLSYGSRNVRNDNYKLFNKKVSSSNNMRKYDVGGLNTCFEDPLDKDLYCVGASTNSGASNVSTVSSAGCGFNSYITDNDIPCKIVKEDESFISNIKQVSLSNNGRISCVLDNLGDVYCWGDNVLGMFNGVEETYRQNDLIQLNYAKKIPLSGIEYIDVYNNYVCATTNNSISCWGDNRYGQLGVSKLSSIYMSVQSTNIANIVPSSLYVADTYACLLADPDNNGQTELFCSGENSGLNLTEETFTEIITPLPSNGQYSEFKANLNNDAYCLKAATDLYCWGNNSFDKFTTGGGTVDINTPIIIPNVKDFELLNNEFFYIENN